MARKAAEAGFDGAVKLFGMTPVEAELELTAFAARQRQTLERLDEAAWLAGRYAAIGWHAPKRYPRRPEGVERRRAEMSDAEMKDALLGFARRRADSHDRPEGGIE